jgi:hypothetical protein
VTHAGDSEVRKSPRQIAARFSTCFLGLVRLLCTLQRISAPIAPNLDSWQAPAGRPALRLGFIVCAQATKPLFRLASAQQGHGAVSILIRGAELPRAENQRGHVAQKLAEPVGNCATFLRSECATVARVQSPSGTLLL